jgi:hypothetical protein
MALSDELRERTLARLRERYRGRFPHERLILLVDRRSDSIFASHVVAVDRTSAWYDFLPAEQLAEIDDKSRPEDVLQTNGRPLQ